MPSRNSTGPACCLWWPPEMVRGLLGRMVQLPRRCCQPGPEGLARAAPSCTTRKPACACWRALAHASPPPRAAGRCSALFLSLVQTSKDCGAAPWLWWCLTAKRLLARRPPLPQKQTKKHPPYTLAVPLLCAANPGQDQDALLPGQRSYPAGYPLPNILSVAATTKDDALAGFSNYGA